MFLEHSHGRYKGWLAGKDNLSTSFIYRLPLCSPRYYSTIHGSQYISHSNRIADPDRMPDSVEAGLNSTCTLVRFLRTSAVSPDQSTGLRGPQLFVLPQLADSKPASINDLATRTLTDHSSASTVVSCYIYWYWRSFWRRGADFRDQWCIGIADWAAYSHHILRTKNTSRIGGRCRDGGDLWQSRFCGAAGDRAVAV